MGCIPFLSIVIFSTEFVFGPACCYHHPDLDSSRADLTNGANDAASPMVALWLVVDVEVALPFYLGAVVQMIKGVTHPGGVV